MTTATDDDPIEVPRSPLNLGLFSILLAGLALSTITVLPGLFEDHIGVLVLIGAIATLGALATGITSVARSSKDRERYGSPILGIVGIVASLLWFAGAASAGVLSKLVTGKLFENPYQNEIARCESGEIVGNCDMAGVDLLDGIHVPKDAKHALALLEKGCQKGDLHCCDIIVSRMKDSAPKDALDAAMKQGVKLCKVGGDPMYCALFRNK